MASNDIRIDVDFVDHPKTKRLMRVAGEGAFWSLVKLFSTVAKVYPKGILTGCNEHDIEDMAGWKGKRGRFFVAITEPDFAYLDLIEGEWVVHDWAEHQPWVYNSKERSEIARQNVSKRYNKQQGSDKYTTNGTINGSTNGIQTVNKRYTDGNESVLPNGYKTPTQNTPSPIPIPEEKKEYSLYSKEYCPPEKESDPSGMHRAPKKFIKPTLSEVQQYCVERKNGINAQQFIDSYESKGWLVGKSRTPMKDWKAAVRVWENNGISNDRQFSSPVVARQSNDRFAHDNVDPF